MSGCDNFGPGSPDSWLSERDSVDYNVFYNSMDSMVFHNDVHSSQFLKEMKVLYDDGLLTDVTLSVDGHKLPAHRVVLAAASPYFKAMFTLDLNESRQDVVELFEVDFESVSQVVTYAYTGTLEICQENVQNLLAAASLFQIIPVQKACARFLETQLDNNNCVGIYCFAQAHSCLSLQVKAREHIEKNFMDVYQCEEFLRLPVDKVKEIVGSDELNVDKEDIVFEAVLAWVGAQDGRTGFLGQLMTQVRFGLISLRFMQERVMKSNSMLSDQSCVSLLQDLKEFESNPHSYQGQSTFSLSLRSGMIKPEHCMLLLGGTENRRPYINCYNPLTREAFFMNDFPVSRRYGDFDVESLAGVVTDKNTLFAGGGNYIYHSDSGEHFDSDDSLDEFEERVVSKDFYRYDNDHNKWMALSPMLFPKSNFSLASLGGKIYCFGGLTENQHPTEIIEVYDIDKNRWSYQGMLPTSLVDLACVVHEEHIFLLGGRTGVGAHNLVVMYHPVKGQWITRAGMLTPRFNFGACIVDDEIYIAGGQIYSQSSHTINRQALKSVEIFSVANNQWRPGPELPEAIYNVGLAVVNMALYACGMTESARLTHPTYRNIVCRLDFSRGQWDIIEQTLCDTRNYNCIAAKLHTRKLSQVFRPEVDT
ncbi:kelch-like protein 28 [Ylistrum balloti]|uniref:kelch-like protein 28 n=1 Tax=Ylistrum balloti TaxID=509963 RepID=UPI002905E517|nr:kelch-like protein 28 [Ylistrum balloti]